MRLSFAVGMFWHAAFYERATAPSGPPLPVGCKTPYCTACFAGLARQGKTG
jgi:hypothetical protein